MCRYGDVGRGALIFYAPAAHKKLNPRPPNAVPVPPFTPLTMDADWLKRKTKSVLADTTITVQGHRAMSAVDIPITLKVTAIELNYGPCIALKARVSVGMETEGWHWDDHPFRGVLKDSDADDPACVEKKGGLVRVLEVGDILDDTPAVRALIAELVEPGERSLYSGTDCTHRARLLASLRSFWS